MRTALHWFRRDLRLDDNTALNQAARRAERLIPVFVLDDTILARPDTGAPRVAFFLACLRELARALRAGGSRLIVARGDPVREIPRLAAAAGAAEVHWNKDYEPYARERDARVTAALGARGVAAHAWKDQVLFEEREILSSAGTPFTVFTPYHRVWTRRRAAAPVAAALAPFPARTGLISLPVPAAADVGAATAGPLLAPGEHAARRRLEAFVRRALGGYARARDLPGRDATSRLSPYLKVGAVSVRRAYAAARRTRAAGARAWRRQLVWRDFYAQLLFHHPNLEREAFRPALRALAWENDAHRFAAWCRGETGYPIVDAAMRELNATGWMHNRLRMIVASFLTKDLLVDWRLGERYFMQRLIDGDLAANNGGWQWAASTGTDPQPYFRIFNPTAQGERFDPDGDYVRRWVPELERVPARWIHRPWDLPRAQAGRVDVILGSTYPERVVRHEEQRPKALALYRACRS